MAWRITEAGLAVLKQGADSAVEANWRLVVSFEGETATSAAAVNVGPSDAPTAFSKNVTSGAPTMSGTDTSGVTLPILRQQSGTINVAAVKDVRVTFDFPFTATPRIAILLDQAISTFPYRVDVQKTHADIRFSQPYTGGIDYVCVEPQ